MLDFFVGFVCCYFWIKFWPQIKTIWQKLHKKVEEALTDLGK